MLFIFDGCSRAILTNKDVLNKETPWQDIWKDDFWGTPLGHSGSHKSFRPLTILSFRFNRYFSGFNPWSYHLTNIILHTITTWLFVRVARVVFNLSDRSLVNKDGHCWTNNQNFALLVSALLFASHPIHTEAVAGVVGRADVGATAFALSSFLAYSSHVKSRNKQFAVSRCHCEPVLRQQSTVVVTNGVAKNKLSSFSISKPFPSVSTLVYFVISMILAAASMLCKEHGITVLIICAVYDVVLSLIRFRRGQVIFFIILILC